MNKINRIIPVLIISLLLYCTIPLDASNNSPDDVKVYNASGEIITAPGKVSAAIIAVEIPRDTYIYANPKGKGIGKATEIFIRKNKVLESWEVRYPEGTEYQAKGDPDTVNIYKKNVRLPVAFTVKSNTPEGSYSIKADVAILICSSDACIPVERTVDIRIRVKRDLADSVPSVNANMSEFLSLKVSGSDSEKIKKITGETEAAAGNASFISESIIFKPVYPEDPIAGLLKAILFGLIAGFILNFMPCVLPVVSLKIMSFVMNAGEKKKIILIQGLLFSAGIIVSFILLAALAAFSGHKWGALFQNEIFIIGMASFIFAMALSLFGVFTLNVPFFAGRAVSKTRGIYADAFIKGIVATLLATPCSGPFLGGTLAWTLTKPPEIIFVIFLSVGIGMALPYILLSFNPSLLKVLPKPGEWMNHFEKGMGFLLLFTVVYLIGILDNSGRMGLILFMLFIAIGLWQYGLFGSIERDRWMRGVSFVILLAVAAAGYGISFKYLFNERIIFHERIPFNSERIIKNRALGIITVVEFTAQWCPNCSLVEKLALEKEEVQNVFARENVEFMVADITDKNPPAESLMSRLGSKSIPLLAVFPPGEGFSSPYCLRDIYSAGDVVAAVNRADAFIKTK